MDQVIKACCRFSWAFAEPFSAAQDDEMLVPRTATKSVVFIGSIGEDGEFVPRATGFLVRAGELPPGSVLFPYLVTAEHVISGMLTRGMAVHCRINLKDGGTAVVPLDGKWWFHPDEKDPTDVAVMPFALREDLADHAYISLIYRPDHIDRIPQLGEEVFIMGLFKNHYGKKRNIPIVRIGNIATGPDTLGREPVWTKYCGYTRAYLVEMRSIAGLSGSPVFKNAEGMMPYPKPRNYMEGTMADQMEQRKKREEIDWYDWYFVGLVHGHFDVRDLTEDASVEDSDERGEINTGMGIVIPSSKVYETLFQPELRAELYRMSSKAREEKGATADADLSDAAKSAPPTMDANPRHKEDFTRLVGAAAKKPRSAD